MKGILVCLSLREILCVIFLLLIVFFHADFSKSFGLSRCLFTGASSDLWK